MISFLSADILGIAVGIVVAVVTVGGFCAYYGRKIYAKKRGKSGGGCCGDCSSCCGCGFSIKKKDGGKKDF